MTGAKFVQCLQVLWWTHLFALVAALVATASTAAGRVRGFPMYINPLEFLVIAVAAEAYLVAAGILVWAVLARDDRRRAEYFLLLACLSIVAAIGTGTVWAILAPQNASSLLPRV